MKEVTSPSVVLLTHTPDPQALIYAAMRQCYSPKTADEIWAQIQGGEIPPGQQAKLIQTVLESGHASTAEHVSFTFSISGISRACSHQLVRHRIASYCLSGDTEVVAFKHHKRGSSKRWTLSELYAMSQDPKRKGRLRLIRLRSVNDDGVIVANKIVSIVYSGKQEVFCVSTKSGRKIKATLKHRFKTPDGYTPLSMLSTGSRVICNGLPAYQNREWVEEHYLTKNMEREKVAELAGVSDACMGVWVRRLGLQKPKSAYLGRRGGGGFSGMFSPEARELLSEQKRGSKNPAWRGGKASANAGRLRCQKIYKANQCEACGRSDGRFERHHLNGDTHNNDRANVVCLCPACHKAFHCGQAVLSVFTDEIVSIDYVGAEETYDIEMEAPNHNFVAEGFVVHNSQQSQRYVGLGGMTYVVPPSILSNPDALAVYRQIMGEIGKAHRHITGILTRDIGEKAKEDARFVLPNACETSIVVTMNCRSLLNFFEERCCRRAQWEIREVSNKMLAEVRGVLPEVFKSSGAKCLKFGGKCPENPKFSCGMFPPLFEKI